MKKNLSTGDVLIKVLSPIVAVVVAMLLGVLLLAVLGENVNAAMTNFFNGSIGSLPKIGDTLSKFAPLVFAALAYAVAMRCGLVNIGGDGQLYMGGIAAGVVAIWGPGFNIPVFGGAIVLVLSIIAGFVAGGLWGFLAGWLKVSFGANEVITTVMLNYVALYFSRYLIAIDPIGPLNDGSGQNQSQAFKAVFAKNFLIDNSEMTMTILLGVLALFLYYVFFFRMKKGYEMRVVGLNATAAEYAGMKVKSNALLSMFLAGGFGGLAGVSELLGSQARFIPDFSSGYGFDGIAVALLGQLHPVGMGLSAVLFAILKSGGLAMGRTGISSYIVNAIQAFVIILVVASVFVQAEYSKKKLIKQAKAARGE